MCHLQFRVQVGKRQGNILNFFFKHKAKVFNLSPLKHFYVEATISLSTKCSESHQPIHILKGCYRQRWLPSLSSRYMLATVSHVCCHVCNIAPTSKTTNLIIHAESVGEKGGGQPTLGSLLLPPHHLGKGGAGP